MNRVTRNILRVCLLEDRINPVTFTVTNTLDTGSGSLRNAVASANLFTSADTIVFDPAVFNTFKSITLTTGEISISGATTIIGPGANLLGISGNSSSRAFNTTAALNTEPISFSGLTIGECLTTGDGGALLIGDESITFTNCNLSNNIALSDGGALSANGAATITLTECNLINNQAQVNAGAIHIIADAATLTLERCTLSANVAVTGSGGAVRIGAKTTGTMTVRNSTLSGNSAPSGGAVALAPSKGTLAIRNSTLTLNDADTGTGGAIARTAGGMVITIESGIVSGNTSAGAPDISSTGTVNVNFSAIGSNAGFTLTGGNNLAFGAVLKLGALADNGGPTKTHLPAVDSPVVDKGTNSTGLTTDQRGAGYLRQRTYGVDIGAIEVATDLLVANAVDSGVGSLRQAITDANVAIGADTVTFDPTVFKSAQVITLTSGELMITSALTVSGPGSAFAVITGNNSSRVFNTTGATNGPITISKLTITQGKATDNGGGGVLIGNEIVTIFDCVISKNTATSPFNGGGIYAGENATLVMSQCTIEQNVATNGAGVYVRESKFELTGSTVSGNQAATSGGGIAIYSSKYIGQSLSNCTLSGNSAGSNGGAIIAFGLEANLFVGNCTIFDNSAQQGGGIAQQTPGGSVHILQTIVSANKSPTATDISGSQLVLIVERSAIGSVDGFSSSGGLNLPFGLDLKLGPLTENGGPTKTHSPASDSPLIDKGSGSLGVTFDQRGTGYPRSMGLATDIGAVEFKDLVIHNTNDSGPGSLRDVVADASAALAPNLVTFDPSLFSTAQTITLTSGEIVIGGEMTVQGAGAALTTIDGNAASRIFKINAPGSKTAVTINDLTLTHGKVTSAGVGGAAIYLDDDNLSLNRVRVSENYVFGVNQYYGGAIYVDIGSGGLTITDSILNDNRIGPAPNGDTSCGGAINIHLNSSVSIIRSTISGNTAGLSGGGIFFFYGGDLLVVDSTISGNKASLNSGLQGGGGVYLWQTTATIRNSTISSNSAALGGGLLVTTNSFVTLQNCTVAFNTAGSSGGIYASGTSSVSPQNSIIAPNQGSGGVTGMFNGSGMSVFGSPNLGPLADNGGPTRTHALLLGSAAIDAGSNPLMLANDQRGPGFSRVIGAAADIGAFESQAPPTPVTVTSVVINDGSVQRSRVTSLTVTFNQPALLPGNPADAFQLRRQIDTASVLVAANVNSATVTLTFTGGPIESQSLADGRYTLTILASKVGYFDGNGDGTPGDDYLLIGTPANGLFRIFGDSDGDGNVAANDFIQFRLALGGNNPIFDFDNDGAVAASDFIQFRLRFGGSV